MKRVTALWPFAALIILPFLFHWKLFTPDATERKIFRGDFLNQHYVWKSYALRRVKSGELPLWNPHVLGGVAFHANPQVGIFYPPTYLLLPFHRNGELSYMALEAYQLLHQVFAGFGMILFMRLLGTGNLGAFFAALVFTFTGFFTTPGHHAIVVTASWIPWTLLAVSRAVERGSPARIGLLTLALALMVLAGHPQVAYYGLLLVLAWAFTVGGLRRAATRLAPALVLALALAAVQLLPTSRLAADSSRAELGYDYATSFGFSPTFLAAAFVPRGQIRLPGQENAAPLHIYVGVGTLLLAAIGLLLSDNPRRLFFAAVALVALFVSFGRESPLFDWFYAGVPGFSRFRVPFRLLGLYTFGMAVLAGVGISVLQRAHLKTRLRLRAITKSAFVILLFLAGWTAYLHTEMASPGGIDPAQAERLVGGAYWALLIATLQWLLLVTVLWRPGDRWAVAAMAVVAVLDLGAFVKDRGERPQSTLARLGDRPVFRLLRSQGYRSRYVTESNLQNTAMLHGVDAAGGHSALVDGRYAELLDASRTSANVLSLLNAKFIVRKRPVSRFPWCGARYASPLPLLDVPHDIAPVELRIVPTVQVSSFHLDWEPLAPGGRAVIELAGKVVELEQDRALDIQFEEPERIASFTVSVDEGNPGIRLQNIELDLNPLGLRADFLVLDGIAINLHALPRAYFMVPSSVPTKLQTLEELRCWSTHQGVQVQDPETGHGTAGFFRKNAARITAYAPERVEIETRSPRAGFVVLADTFRPGWVADVDGVDAPVSRAEGTMRAVAVAEGEHEVRFRYEPASLASGTIVSVGALIVVSLLFLLGRVGEAFTKKTRETLSAPDEDFVAGDDDDDPP